MWSVKILEPSYDGRHLFSVTNTDSGETVYGRFGVVQPTWDVMPKSFFDAIKKFFETEAAPKIEPQLTLPIEDPKDEWSEITKDVTPYLKKSNKPNKWKPYKGSNLTKKASDSD